MKRGRDLLLILMLALAGTAVAGVNSSIKIEPGEVLDKGFSTVNGRISIGDGVTILGEVESVNGAIEIGHDVRVESISAVNGSVEIGAGTVVSYEVSTINGQISMETGTWVQDISTVNGELELSGVEVDNDLSTYNGDMKLTRGTNVGGNIVIKDSRGNNNHRSKPLRIHIEEGSRVRGNIIVENDDLEVEVYLRGGSIAGELLGARIVEK